MRQKPERTIKKTISNGFGALGYLFCALQWFWAVMLYFSVVQPFILFISSRDSGQVNQAPSFTFTLPAPVQIAIIIIVVVAMIVLTIYMLIKIPMNIVKTSNKAVHKTTATMVPMVIKAQHKKDTPKARVKIASKLIIAVKALVVMVPVVLTVASGLLGKQSIDYSIAVIIGCGLACFSIVFFAVQYAAASMLRVKISDLW
ncbi:MAG TPA: hypothetical protein VL481_00500 [Verrucomicrobiae bacterium]|nr:hypothetical protein [Verrucomicrobiae bacterium]